MNQELHDILRRVFDMPVITPVAHPLHAVHAFQVMHVTMTNRIMAEKSAIAGTSSFTALSTARPRTANDILMITQRLRTYSIAFSIMGGRPAFDNSADPQFLI